MKKRLNATSSEERKDPNPNLKFITFQCLHLEQMLLLPMSAILLAMPDREASKQQPFSNRIRNDSLGKPLNPGFESLCK